PLLTFESAETAAMPHALEKTIRERQYTCYGCALMRDHIHLLIRKHRDAPELIIDVLQAATRDAVRAVGRAERGGEHPVWGGPGWKVHLNTRADMERTVQYIWENPLKI